VTTPSRTTVPLPLQFALAMLPVMVVGALVVAWLELRTEPADPPPVTVDEVGRGMDSISDRQNHVDDGGTWAATDVNPDGTPVAWSGCAPIHWVHNPDQMPMGALADIEEALRRVSVASGLTFVHDGGTDELPSAARPTHQPTRYATRGSDAAAPVLVAFVGLDIGDLPLAASDRAITVAVSEGNERHRAIITGQVILRSDAGEVGNFTSRARGLGAVLMHEFGHLVGLTHVGDPGELMFAQPTMGDASWGPGDLAGLRQVGARGGC